MPESDHRAAAGTPATGSGSDYLGFVIHEARNPLASALWSAQMLERLAPEERGGERGAKLAARIGRAIGRLGRLLEDHFLAERIRAGGYPLRPEPVEIVALLAERASLAGLALLLRGEPMARIAADPALASRALDGLLAAAGRGVERLEVTAALRGSDLVLRLAGAPLGPEALERPGKGAPSDPSGHALALVMAGAVARAHGGSLAAEEGSLLLTWPRAEP